MHLKCTKKTFAFWRAARGRGSGYFRAIWCFVSLVGNRIRFAIVSILFWSGSRVCACARRWERGGQAGGPCAEGPEEAKPKVYVVLGVDWSAGPVR